MNTVFYPRDRVPAEMLEDMRAIASRKNCDLSVVTREALAMYIDDFKAGLLPGESLLAPVENLPTPEQRAGFQANIDHKYSVLHDDIRDGLRGYSMHAKTAWSRFTDSIAGASPERRSVEQWEKVITTIDAILDADRIEGLIRVIVSTAARSAA